MLSGADARALEPALSDNVAAAMLAPSDAQVDPKKLLPALKAILKKRGAAVFDKQVEHASREEGSWRLLFSDGDGVLAGGIVAATGAGPHWPLDSIARPPIYPVKGEAYSTEARANSLLTRVVRGPGAYLCPKTGGRIVVGASEAPNRDDISVSESAISALKDAAAAVAPAMAEMREDSRWAGLRPATPDGAPILGPDRTAAGVFYALGHHRNGVLLAPASAEALAAAILGRPCPFDMSPFRADRFG
jgi:glycine oxidase